MDELHAAQVVEEWRAAERRLATRDPDAADFEDIIRAVDRLRDEYARVTAQRVRLSDLSTAGRSAG